MLPFARRMRKPVMPNREGAALTCVNVALGTRSYVIEIGTDTLRRGLPAHVTNAASRIVVVTNDVVFPLYGAAVATALEASERPIVSVVLPDGEAHKDWQHLNQIFDALLSNACDRKTLLVALGGGVIGDMVGFAAATYQRGVSFVQIPTTLLSQVDSSVGGKTGINHPLGKNMVGAFYQPKHVLIDTDVLRTLPDREYRAGLAEVIKYGIALDAAFFAWLETNIDALSARDSATLAYAIRRSCEIKAGIVANDEYETRGARALLNFGHTFGHAIETELGYGTWLHGEAVGCGMALATNFSAILGRLPEADRQRVLQLIQRAGLTTAMPAVAVERMLLHMARDKKNESGAIRLILLDGIGQCHVDGTVDRAAIATFLAQQ